MSKLSGGSILLPLNCKINRISKRMECTVYYCSLLYSDMDLMSCQVMEIREYDLKLH